MARRAIPALLTAHHLDDQAETLLMRLARGSGVGGLAAIRARRPLVAGGSASVYRPLLGWRRAELAAFVAALDTVDDPSNRDLRFDRAQLRNRLPQMQGLDPVALARSAGLLGEAEDALAAYADALFDERVTAANGEIILRPQGLALELRRRLVARCLALASDADPRGEALATLLAALDAGRTATLAGLKCIGGETWRFVLAPARRNE